MDNEIHLSDYLKEGWLNKINQKRAKYVEKSTIILNNSNIISNLYENGCSNSSFMSDNNCISKAAKIISNNFVEEKKERFFGENITEAINIFKAAFRK